MGRDERLKGRREGINKGRKRGKSARKEYSSGSVPDEDLSRRYRNA